ncbi:MAG TPA: hypothetical protein VMY16_11675 [Ilumatobacteraceae bacterium]|nr:hypothetical protein [Ilumatobacteraceae bacterium]
MDEQTHTHPSAPATAEPAPPVATATQPAVIVQTPEPDTKSFRFGSFLAGFLAAIVLAGVALAVFLVVSDSDDDGNIQLDVPAVDVDTGG